MYVYIHRDNTAKRLVALWVLQSTQIEETMCRQWSSNAEHARSCAWLVFSGSPDRQQRWSEQCNMTQHVTLLTCHSHLDMCQNILSTPKNSCLSESKTSSQVGVLNGKMCFLEKNSITQYSYSTVELRAFIRRRDRIDRAKQRIGVCNSSLQHGRPFECMSCLNNSGPAVEHGTTNESQ